ncbi:MAG: tRNA dihydrouridine synthase DusB [Clostridia bacterium]|jgi:tRNA-dihydrouridine synthase B|nr:tRNA dihydrouridine synthase DusB [Clostridia bacterium]
MYIKKLKIGNVELENNLILAPMAGVTDLPFRKVCKEFGPGLVCTEMVSSKAIFYDDSKTKLLMNTEGEKRPISMQIFGSDEETMGYAAKYVSELADIVDINMGCPAPKVVKNGDGSKLLLDIEKAEKVIKAVVKNSTKPVTLKLRKGWDTNNIVAVEFAQMAEKAGVSAITIHGRTRTEMYSGKADLDIIKKVKESVNIPVIGNGDIVDEESALKMFEYTGVDGIMIGRGSFGNPWIFKRIKDFLETGEKLPEVTQQEKLRVIKKHIELELQEKEEITAIREMRKHISWYTKNMPNSSEFRNEINKIEDKDELIKKIVEFCNEKTLKSK